MLQIYILTEPFLHIQLQTLEVIKGYTIVSIMDPEITITTLNCSMVTVHPFMAFATRERLVLPIRCYNVHSLCCKN